MNSCGAAFGVVGGGGGNERFGVIFKNVLNATCHQRLSSASQCRVFWIRYRAGREREERGEMNRERGDIPLK